MQIIETNLFRILTPEKGYKLINKKTNKSFNKVYLGVNDSIDNYDEVVDDVYVDIKYTVELDNLKSEFNNNQENNEMNLDVILMAMAKLYETFEPFLAMLPMTMSAENTNNNSNPLVDMYICIIKRQLMTIDQIPQNFRNDVEKLL